MMKFTSKLATAILAIGLCFGSLTRTAEAAPLLPMIDGTAAVSFTSVESSTLSIGSGTTFSFGVSYVSSKTGDLGSLPAFPSTFTTDDITATNGSAVSFTADWGSFLGEVVSVIVSGPIQGRTVTVNVLGAFDPAGVMSGFTGGPMSITFSATQTGAGGGGAVSASYSIASPPTVTVPEPVSLSLLGAGLLALGVARRAHRRDQHLKA